MKMDQIEFEQFNEIFLLLRRRMLCFDLWRLILIIRSNMNRSKNSYTSTIYT